MSKPAVDNIARGVAIVLTVAMLLSGARRAMTGAAPPNTFTPPKAVGGGEFYGDKSVDRSGDNSGTSGTPENTSSAQPPNDSWVAWHATFQTERGRFELPLPLRADR